MSEEKCCLCTKAVGDAQSKKKRKKLYGENATIERRVLESVCNKQQLGLGGFIETTDQDALICSGCIADLCKIDCLRDKLEQAENSVYSKLHRISTDSRKRSAPEEDPGSSALVCDSSDQNNDLPGCVPAAHKSSMSSPPVEVSIV